MPDPTPKAARRELMADFGEVMTQIQLLEIVLLGLALSHGYTPGQEGTDEWGQRVRDLFAMPAGQLVKVTQIGDPGLAEQVQHAVWLRNRVVHGSLIYIGLDLASGKSTIEKQRAWLHGARNSIATVRVGVEAELARSLEDQGLEPMSAEQAAQLWREAPT